MHITIAWYIVAVFVWLVSPLSGSPAVMWLFWACLMVINVYMLREITRKR